MTSYFPYTWMVGYTGPLFIEREVGDQQQRFNDIAHGVRFIREVLG